MQANQNVDLVRRVVDNLVRNTLKFTPAGRRITVEPDEPAVGGEVSNGLFITRHIMERPRGKI